MIVAFSGGVGGAKLVLGLAKVLPPNELTVVANTADDFVHLGLHISPDVDTVMYTLAGLSNPETGWGRSNETWQFMSVIRQLGGEDWFQLGDLDLGVHVERTRRLAEGQRLTQITGDFCQRFGVKGVRVLPMSDDPVSTMVKTPEGWIPFQHYFVKLRCKPVVNDFDFRGVSRASLTPEIRETFASSKLKGLVFCPSNPFVSIDPILAIPGMRDLLEKRTVPLVGVSPIVGGKALKGPTAKMMAELGIETSTKAVAEHYQGLIDGWVIDLVDKEKAILIEASGIQVLATHAVMNNTKEKETLAADVLQFIDKIQQ